MSIKLPSQVCSEVIQEWKNKKEKILGWNPSNHDEEIVKEEQIKIINELEELLITVFDSIDEYNKQTLIQHHKLLELYGKSLPEGIKNRYVKTIMKWSVI